MKNLRPVIIFELYDARLILSLAKKYHLDDIYLILPKNSGGYLGGQYINMMSRILTEEYPSLRFHIIADCVDHAGHVMENLAAGVKYVIFNGESNIYNRLSELAASYQAVIMKQPLETFTPTSYHRLENELKAWWNIKT